MDRTDMRLFCEGNCRNLYDFLGANLETGIAEDGRECEGVRFSIWAPNARSIQVIGTFNNWTGTLHTMDFIKEYGIWTLFIPGVKVFDEYKYNIQTQKGRWTRKSDPCAKLSALRPETNSVVYESVFEWDDRLWMQRREESLNAQKPMNIYEIHCGSWIKGNRTENQEFIDYRELADKLIPYLKKMNYNFIELMPLTEHSADASWGYQNSGYFSVTSRYGTPDGFKYLVNEMHRAKIGVILDWVPAHFSKDLHGLSLFDGTRLYESKDPLKNKNNIWDTFNFDFEKGEVQSFLLSSAFYFLKEFHIDGIRVDAVSNMLYYNYDYNNRVKNEYGGFENIGAIDFIKKLNRAVKKRIKGVLMIAEESGSWENVTKPDYLGGLGFDYKWNMGWMNDSLKYMNINPIYRSFHHNLVKQSIEYTYNERYILPLSHDEAVSGKKSILNKMSARNKFNSYRLFLGYMMTCPGKKLMFMGNEFAQTAEWSYNTELNWDLLKEDRHEGFLKFVKDLNYIYINEKSLWELDSSREGFMWIDGDNERQSVISYVRRSGEENDFIVSICNFSEISYKEYKIGIPRFTEYKEILNSDNVIYGGANQLNENVLAPVNESWNGQPFHINARLPASSVVLYKPIFT